MKNKLTEQKINEFLTKALTAILTKRASKTLDKLMKTNPDFKKGVNLINQGAETLRKDLERKFGKEYADKAFGK